MMVNVTEIFKRWDSDPGHNTKPILTRCPLCIKEDKRKKAFFKNLQSLSFHLATNHQDESRLEDSKLLIRAISTAIKWGILVT